MQNELASRIEKIWAMADIALLQGYVDYGTDGHSKVARLSGMTFKFINEVLVRVRGHRLDIAITQQAGNKSVVFFPGAQTSVQFLKGDDEILTHNYNELCVMQKTFTSKKAA